jgi:superfamily I DNA/RNA helicase
MDLPVGGPMQILTYRDGDFRKSLMVLARSGGMAQRAAQYVEQILGRLSFQTEPELLGRLTKNGESRIPHCFKYDLPSGYRLVCSRTDDTFWLLYVGSHADCDRWIEQNVGLRPVVDKKTKRVTLVQEVDAAIPLPRRPIAMMGDPNLCLLDRLAAEEVDVLGQWLRPRELQRLSRVTTACGDDELTEVVAGLADETARNRVLSVMLELRDGSLEKANALIRLYSGEAAPADAAPNLLNAALASGVNSDTLVNLRDLSEIEIEHLFKRASFQDWLLFLHPDQRKLAQAESEGPLLLKGISGSGKTSVLVHRAKALAEKYPTERVAIFTLNRALAGLIGQLLDALCPPAVRERIRSQAIYDLCSEIVRHFEPERPLLTFDPLSEEPLEDCWTDSFAKPEQQETLAPIVRSLRETYRIDPERYLRDEFIWVRSAFAAALQVTRTGSVLRERSAYGNPELSRREGRCIPFAADWRERVLKALAFYEEHLAFGGFVDPAALSLAAHAHLDELRAGGHPFRYRCVLVDEEQDLGTVELEIVSTLAGRGVDCLFLAGDSSQQVFPKHHDLASAGIAIGPKDRRYLRRNYRNTRQILEAGLAMLQRFGTPAGGAEDEFKGLAPEASPRESALPLAIKISAPEEEIPFVSYFVGERRRIDPSSPIGIVACGVREDQEEQLEQIRRSYEHAGLKATLLTGGTKIEDGCVYLSPLETVKGFEFGLVVVSHCTDAAMPNPALPDEEAWRDARRLYVALTRARDEVVFTYSGESSKFLRGMEGHVLWSNASIQGFQGYPEAATPERTPPASVTPSAVTSTVPVPVPAAEPNLAAALPDSSEVKVRELVAHLASLGLEVVDKRSRGGALWVVGGTELANEMWKLKRASGAEFAFVAAGGRSTGKRPAWYLVTKGGAS